LVGTYILHTAREAELKSRTAKVANELKGYLYSSIGPKYGARYYFLPCSK
jgi:hypothetical protein